MALAYEQNYELFTTYRATPTFSNGWLKKNVTRQLEKFEKVQIYIYESRTTRGERKQLYPEKRKMRKHNNYNFK